MEIVANLKTLMELQNWNKLEESQMSSYFAFIWCVGGTMVSRTVTYWSQISDCDYQPSEKIKRETREIESIGIHV